MRQWLLRLSLESIKTGELTIPPLEVHYTVDAASSTFKTLANAAVQRSDHERAGKPGRSDEVPRHQAARSMFRFADAVAGWIAWTAGGAAVAVAAPAFDGRRREASTTGTVAGRSGHLQSIADLEEVEHVANDWRRGGVQ